MTVSSWCTIIISNFDYHWLVGTLDGICFEKQTTRLCFCVTNKLNTQIIDVSFSKKGTIIQSNKESA